MAKQATISAQERSNTVAQTRANGAVPAVVYGFGIENQPIAVDAKEFEKVLIAAGLTTLVKLSARGVDHNVLIREVQRHPVRDTVQHVDFYQVNMEEAVTADVTLVFEGESAAVKDLGGVLMRSSDYITVEALPANLPREIIVSIEALTDFDAAIKVADLPIPEGVTVQRDGDDLIASVQPPRTEAELEQLSEEVTEDVEGVEGVADAEEGADADSEGEGEEKAEGEEAAAPEGE